MIVVANSRTEETIYPSYSPSSFDFDTIYSMFPARNTTGSNVQYPGEVIFQSDIPDDPLFGLMDEPMLPYTDIKFAPSTRYSYSNLAVVFLGEAATVPGSV